MKEKTLGDLFKENDILVNEFFDAIEKVKTKKEEAKK